MATSKTNNVRRNAIASVGMTLTSSGHGIAIVNRMKDTVGAPNVESRIKVVIGSNIVDAFEGQTETRSIWGPTTNRDYVARVLGRQTGNPDEPVTVLTEVSRFLINRGLAQVIIDLVKFPSLKPSESLFTKSEFYRELVKSLDDITVASAVAEIVMPTLIEMGMISSNGRYAAQDEYPFHRVEVADLGAEIAVIQAFAALDSVKISKIDVSAKQSKSVFAESVAELFRPVGLALAQVPELSRVLDDVVLCVRANLTPAGSVGSDAIGVGSLWASNPHVAELAQCLPFVRAALALPADRQRQLSNDSGTLEAWIKLVVQMLRDTVRYKWVSKAESLRNYGTTKVRSLSGAPISLIAHRDVQVEPIAQAVIASEDAILGDSAVYITATRDRIADTVEAAYGRARFSTKDSVNTIALVADSVTELGYNGWTGAMLIDAWGHGLTLSDIAVLIADDVYVQIGQDASIIVNSESSQFDPVWWFGVNTTEKQLVVASGQHLGSRILTCDPVEALLAYPDFESKATLESRKQVIGPNAFNATVTGFDRKKVLQPLTDRFGYELSIAGQRVSGKLRAQDFASLRSQPLVNLVRPHFNAQVIKGAEESFAAAMMLAQTAAGSSNEDWNSNVKPSDDLFSMMQEKCVLKLLQLAQQLSPAFRDEVQEVIIDRVLASEMAVGEKAQLLRAKMIQSVFAARCDLIAFEFFLHVQGISTDGWHTMILSGEMDRVCATFGTDRSPRSL